MYVLVRTSTCWYVLVHTGMYYTYTYTYQYMLICTSTYRHVLYIFPPVGIFGYKLGHATMSLLVQCHTALYPLVLFWIHGGTRRYKAVKLVHGGTWQYEKVPYPWIWRYKEVHEGTRPCTALYRLVPPYPGVRDFLVLPCIAWYRLVPPCIQKRTRRYERKPEFGKLPVCTSTYKYILVHTDSYKSCKSMNCYVPSAFSTYQYKPVHTGTYRYVLVCTGMYWFVLVHTSTDK